MIVRYCAACGTPNSVEPASRQRTFCFGCGELLAEGSSSHVGRASQRVHDAASITNAADLARTAGTAEVIGSGVASHPTQDGLGSPSYEKAASTAQAAKVASAAVPSPVISSGVASDPKQDGLGSPSYEINRADEPAPPPLSDGRWLYAATVTLAPEPAAPPIAAVASLAAAPPAPRRFPRLHSSAGFVVSTVVHTIAFVVLSLLIVTPLERAPVMNFVSSRPAHQSDDELDVAEFQVIEVTANVESVAQVSHEEMLASATELDVAALAEQPGLAEATDPGQFTLPDGLLATRAGGRGGALGASGAAFSQRLRREKAKSGDVQISLLWNNFNDIDVHVRCPSGELISFDHRKSRCRGELDVDMNARGPESDEPVENIFWPAGKAPFGDYYVVIHHYRNHGDQDPTAFEVQVKVDGRVRKFQGELTHGDPPLIIYRFHRSRGGNVEDDFYVE